MTKEVNTYSHEGKGREVASNCISGEVVSRRSFPLDTKRTSILPGLGWLGASALPPVILSGMPDVSNIGSVVSVIVVTLSAVVGMFKIMDFCDSDSGMDATTAMEIASISEPGRSSKVEKLVMKKTSKANPEVPLEDASKLLPTYWTNDADMEKSSIIKMKRFNQDKAIYRNIGILEQYGSNAPMTIHRCQDDCPADTRDETKGILNYSKVVNDTKNYDVLYAGLDPNIKDVIKASHGRYLVENTIEKVDNKTVINQQVTEQAWSLWDKNVAVLKGLGKVPV